jgi:hypothetical protein
VFFIIAVAPSFLSEYYFFHYVSYYEQGGQLLVSAEGPTPAGIRSAAVSVGISASIALIASVGFFWNWRPTKTSH